MKEPQLQCREGSFYGYFDYNNWQEKLTFKTKSKADMIMPAVGQKPSFVTTLSSFLLLIQNRPGDGYKLHKVLVPSYQ